jgi:hypothetical protein
MGKDNLASSRTLFFTSNATAPHPGAAPPDYPINLPAAAPAREAAWAANLTERKVWNTYIIVRTITGNQFAAAINNVYYADLDDPTKGLNVISLSNLVTHIHSTYAMISQPNVDDNMSKFVTGIKPSLPPAVYTCKKEKCQTFAQDAGIPISEATMVTTGTKATLNCSGMELAWRKWKHRLLIDHTWDNWKLHWTAVFAETRNINRMIANDSAFANQAATNTEQAAMMAKSLDNLANAAIQKNDTMEKLVTANAKLAKALTDANAAITQLHLPNPPNPPNPPSTPSRSLTNNCRPSHWSAIKPNWDPTSYCLTHGLKLNVDTPAPPAPTNETGLTLQPPHLIPRAAARPTKIGLRTPDGSNQRTCRT